MHNVRHLGIQEGLCGKQFIGFHFYQTKVLHDIIIFDPFRAAKKIVQYGRVAA